MSCTFRLVARPESDRGLVRLNPEQMVALGLGAGDSVALDGTRRTHGRVLPADVPAEEAHADAMLAANTGVAPKADIALAPARLGQLGEVALRVDRATGTETGDLRDLLFDMALTEGDRLSLPRRGGTPLVVEVAVAQPGGAGHVGEDTVLTFRHPAVDTTTPGSGTAAPHYDGVGGLSEEIARVHEIVAAPLLRPDLFDRLGIAPPRGVLFSGPPGSGKTLLARAVAAQTQAGFFHVMGPELVSKHYGESEAALRRVFDAASQEAPSIIFIDEIDAIAPRRDDMSADKQVERRMVAQLLTLLDGLAPRGQVVVLAATNMPDALDPALRRPGRLDREIVFAPPKPRQRREILDVHLARAPLAPDADLDRIAEAAHGYVGADLAALAREAAIAALSRAISEAGGEGAVMAEKLFVEHRDLEHGLAVTAPSALRGAGGNAATASMSAIGGLDLVKRRLRHAIGARPEAAETFARFGVVPSRGILLVGPPGSGKTLIARAVASEAGMNFVPVRPTDLLSRHFGEAERMIARLFASARQSAPTLLFFDEFDAIAPRRGGHDAVVDRIVAQFLVELDGIAGRDGVLVLAATNRAAAIDPALTRPGRFDEVFEIPLPDAGARAEILALHMKERPKRRGLDFAAVSALTEGASGADLAAIATTAARAAALRELESGRADFISDADLNEAVVAWRAQHRTRGSDHINEGAMS
jgi:transitional endoplasmic reticulum ATPase